MEVAALLDGPFRDESPFWEALDRGELQMPQCAGCGRWQWPPTPRCGWCGSFEHAWVTTELRGTLYSWTRIWTQFAPERAAHGPFVVVLIELPQAGNSRLIGTLDGPEDNLRIGAAVTGRIVPPSPEAKGMPSVVWSIDEEA
jgi:uncharacterized OB-fold protein